MAKGLLWQQRLFDNACKIVSQGRLSVTAGSGACMYRGEAGCRCALGWSIESDEDAERLEFNTPGLNRGKPNEVAAFLGAEDEEDIEFLQELQQCHDAQATFIENNIVPESALPYLFAGALKAFAERQEDAINISALREELVKVTSK
jgi:hypothetical protein